MNRDNMIPMLAFDKWTSTLSQNLISINYDINFDQNNITLTINNTGEFSENNLF